MSKEHKEIAEPCNNCKQLVNRDSDYCINCGYPMKIFDKTFYQKKKKPFTLFSGINVKNPMDVLVMANVGLFVVMLLPGIVHPAIYNPSMLFFPSPSGPAVIAGFSEKIRIFENGEYWRLISAMYMHGNIIHIAFNMLYLRQMAPLTEQFYNWTTFFIVYTLSGIVGNVIAIMLEGPVIGASGALFGIVGSLIVLGKLSRSLSGVVIYASLGKWVLFMLLFGFLMPGISNAAHIGGLVAGMGLGYLLHNPKYKLPYYARLVYYILLFPTVGGIFMFLKAVIELF